MGVASSEDEDMVILEASSPSEKVAMPVSYGLPSPYFHFYLPFIKDMRVLLPFHPRGSEDSECCALHLVPNIWGFIRAFEVICYDLKISPTIGFFSFYATRPAKG